MVYCLKSKFHCAAFAYVASALLTIFLTLFLGVTPERFRAEAPFFLLGLPVVFLFGFLIYKGKKWMIRILSIIAGIRSILFFVNALGINPRLNFKTFDFQVGQTSATLQPLFLINGFIVGIAVYFMVRAGWSNH